MLIKILTKFNKDFFLGLYHWFHGAECCKNIAYVLGANEIFHSLEMIISTVAVEATPAVGKLYDRMS